MQASVSDIAGRAFDYVVIGGGVSALPGGRDLVTESDQTAGLVVASRLSEDPSISVLVLEAGGADLDDPSKTMSGTYAKNFFHPEKDWAFMTVPQEHSDGNVFYWPRGKGLGGSSAMNFYAFVQPPATDIDAIEQLGNPGWNWETYMRYSKKSQKFHPPDAQRAAAERLHFDPKHHGTEGPISSTYAPLRAGWETLYQDTLGNLGLKPVKDAVSGDGNGAWMSTVSVNPQTNKRSYAVEYLELAKGRKNLSVVVSAPVTRILTRDEKGTGGEVVASGVEFIHEGKTYSVNAAKEVILSAGAIKSPQILELSGIGNPDILAKLGVPTKVELPGVGENVQEHLFVATSFELKEPEKFNTLDPVADPAVLEEQLKLYAENKGLFLLSMLGSGTASLDRVSPSRGPDLRAALAARIQAGAKTRGEGLEAQYAIQREKLNRQIASLTFVGLPTYLARPNPAEPQKKYMNVVSVLNHPWSRGTIHAASPDPSAPPAIDPHYFEDEFDLQSLVELVKFTRSLAKTSPLSGIIKADNNPGPEVQTDAEIATYVKQFAGSIAHTCGSCSMLSRKRGGVVDPRLKVYGTANIRVVDLSILPLHIGAATQTYVYGMAEQAADIIKGAL